MKKKKLKKISKYIYEYSKSFSARKNKYAESEEKLVNRTSYEHIEYDEEISKKFKKFVLNLFKLNLNVNIYEKDININGNLGNSHKEDYIEISIDQIGFSIRRNYGFRIYYKDSDIFNELKSIVKEKLTLKTKEEFNNIIDDIGITYKLVREDNLNYLIDNI
jgi:hypothetical protein